MQAGENAVRPGRHRWPAIGLSLLVCGACANSGNSRRVKPSKEVVVKLAAVERAYRGEAPEYAALRDDLIGDPVAAAWLTRMFVRDVVRRREGRPLEQDQNLLRAAANLEDPVEKRAIDELVVLGAVAVPILVEELLLHDQSHNRQYGIELIGYIGRPALAAVLEVARSGRVRDRRAAARALGVLWREPEAMACLIRLAGESDFTVRADAARGLRHGGEAAAATLRAMARRDPDAFVRRTAIAALVDHPGRATADALIDCLVRYQDEADSRGYEATQAALVELAAATAPRSVESWRRWAASLPE